MTALAIVLILLSAGLHAGWNLLSKRGQPSSAFYLLSTIGGIILLAPFLIVYRQLFTILSPQTCSLIALAGLCNAFYYSALAGAYSRGSLSIAYPLARAVPIFFVIAASLLLGRGRQISPGCVAGGVMVAVGCILLPMQHFRDLRLANYLTVTCALALLAGVGTAGYTLCDDEALRQLRHHPDFHLTALPLTLFYAALETLASASWQTLWCLKSAGDRRTLSETWVRSKHTALLTGIIIWVAYALVLLAYAFVRNVSYVASFRQVSILMGVALGITVLGEPRTLPKIIGTVVIFLGLLLVGLS